MLTYPIGIVHVKESSTLKTKETNGGLVYFHLCRDDVNIFMHGLDGLKARKWLIRRQQNLNLIEDCRSKFGRYLWKNKRTKVRLHATILAA